MDYWPSRHHHEQVGAQDLTQLITSKDYGRLRVRFMAHEMILKSAYTGRGRAWVSIRILHISLCLSLSLQEVQDSFYLLLTTVSNMLGLRRSFWAYSSSLPMNKACVRPLERQCTHHYHHRAHCVSRSSVSDVNGGRGEGIKL